MGSSQSEIAARLTLNGAQFSSEASRIFAEMEANSRDAASRTKQAFESSFREIQQLSQRALSLPRGAGGALNLDVAGARQSAAAAEAEAIALREFAAAAELAARKSGDLSENTRIYLQAARAAAIEAENTARALLQEANALDLIQTELNQTASATDLVVLKNRQLNASIGGSGMVAVQASQQFQDFFIQVGAGQNPISALAMQGSQLAFVMQNAGGASSKFASILAGPWGAAVIGGLMLLGMFSDRLFDLRTALEKETAELVKNYEKTQLATQAKQEFERTSQGLIEWIDKTTDAIERQNRSLEEQTRIEQVQLRVKAFLAESALGAERAALKKDREELDRLKASNTGEGAEGGAYWRADLEKRIIKREEMIRDLEARISQADRAERMLGFPAAERAARAAADPVFAIEEKYRKLADAAKDAAKGNDALAASLTETLSKLAKQEAAEKEAYQKSQRKGRAPSFGAQVEQAQRAEYADAARQYLGMNERRDKADLMSLFKQAGISIDPEMIAWCAAFVNAVLATKGLKGTGTLAAQDFLKFGEKTTKPTRGDIVVLERGGGGQGHVGFFEGFDSKGNVRVLGGNQGNGVSVDTFSKDKVLGFRRIPDAADQEKALQAQAEAMERILKASEKQLSVDADSLRFMGLKVRGLDEQARAEQEIAERRRRFEEEMADLAKTNPLAAASERERTAGLDAELAKLTEQGDAYAKLLLAAGDQTQLTEEQRKALDDANDAMLAQLTAAKALAKTAADRLAIEEAIVRVQARLGAAREKGDETARADKKRADEVEREQKKIEDERVRREEDNIRGLANFYRDAFRSGGKSIIQNFKDEMLDMIAMVAARWTMAMLSGQKTSLGSIFQQMGAQSGVGGQFPILNMFGLFGGGGIAGGAGGAAGGLGSIFGGAAAGAGGLVGGASGAAGAATGGLGALGAVGSAIPYVGAALAAISFIMPLIGGLSTKRGSATLAFNEYGELGVGSSRGNSSSRVSAAKDAVGGIADALKNIADQLGGDLTGTPTVSIGVRDKNWRVDPTGRGITKTKNGAIDFGEDQEAAIRYAIGEALRDGVISGISDASKKILASGQQLERAIEKAIRIEDVPKRLAAILDPVGYAIDEFNKDWQKTIDALKEGGASAQQMADAQKLYRLELEQVKASAKEASAGLKDFLADLNFGSASPYSLRDQEAMARAALQPFLDKINAGERIDQEKYTEAAQKYLDIERSIYGSGGSFFAAMDLVQAATNKAINTIDNAKPIRTESDPFAQATATNTATANELLEQVSNQLANLPQSFAEKIMGYRETGDRSFFDNPRGLLREVWS